MASLRFQNLLKPFKNNMPSATHNAQIKKICPAFNTFRYLDFNYESNNLLSRRYIHLTLGTSLMYSKCFHGKNVTCFNQLQLQSASNSKFGYNMYQYDYPYRKFSLSFNKKQRAYDPHQAQRRQKLMVATYISCFIGVCLLGTVGFNMYGKMRRKAIGIEDIKIREYGRRPHLYRYRGFIFPNFVVDDVKSIHQFKVREDDVWIVSFPKSGTTWVQEIAYLINTDLDFERANNIKTDVRCPYFEFSFPGKKTIDEMPSPRIIKSHLPYSMLPNDVKIKRPKIIYIYRNPKDVVVSFYHFAIEFLAPVNKFHGTFERYCELFTEDLVAYGPWWKHVNDAQKHMNEDNVLMVSFEDLKKDLPEVIRVIARFLGKSLTVDQVMSVAKHCSFSSMKSNSATNYTWLQESGMADSTVNFMRKGEVGQWKNQLSGDIVAKLDDMIKNKLITTGINIQESLDDV